MCQYANKIILKLPTGCSLVGKALVAQVLEGPDFRSNNQTKAGLIWQSASTPSLEEAEKEDVGYLYKQLTDGQARPLSRMFFSFLALLTISVV